MMRARNEHASLEPPYTRQFPLDVTSHTATPPTLPFEPMPLPGMGLAFLPQPPSRLLKRSRATADIDGEHSCLQKKKRRLRLFLITSRLSPQFSHPATNIVDRGSSKIAVWAKQKSLGRNLLRKAAILNHVRCRIVSTGERGISRRRVLAEQERERNELALARLEFNHGSINIYPRPVASRIPLVPSAAAFRTGGRLVVSGSPTSSPTTSRSPSPTPPSPPLVGSADQPVEKYSSPNEAYTHLLPRALLSRKDYQPPPPSPLDLSNYDAFDTDEDCYARLEDDGDDDDDENLTMQLFSEDEDGASVLFSPSTVRAASSPPRIMQAGPNILNHGDCLSGYRNQVNNSTEMVCPSPPAEKTTMSTTSSASPDAKTLSASAPCRRADSLAMFPNFRPILSGVTSADAIQKSLHPTPPALSMAYFPNSTLD